jgi:predicted transcriptional regulator
MLGIRLDPETERELEQFSKRSRRSKSQIAREAIQQYVARYSHIAHTKAEWAEIVRCERDDAAMSTVLGDAMRELDDRN